MSGDGAFAAWFIFCALVAVAVVSVGLWAIVQIVTWLTGLTL